MALRLAACYLLIPITKNLDVDRDRLPEDQSTLEID